MSLKIWLSKQGFPHGMECVGEARLQQLWDAAQEEAAREDLESMIGERLEAIFYQDENGTRWVYSDEACASIGGPDSHDKELGRAALYVPYE